MTGWLSWYPPISSEQGLELMRCHTITSVNSTGNRPKIVIILIDD